MRRWLANGLMLALMLSQVGFACSLSQKITKVQARRVIITVALDGAPIAGAKIKLEKEIHFVNKDGEKDSREEVFSEKESDLNGQATFELSRGHYWVTVEKGNLSSLGEGIDVEGDQDSQASIEVSWPFATRIDARNLSGSLSAKTLVKSGGTPLQDLIANRREKVLMKDAHIELTDLDGKKIAETNVNEFGNFVIPAQAPGYYVFKFVVPQEGSLATSLRSGQMPPQATALLHLYDTSSNANLNLIYSTEFCGSDLIQDAAQN